MEGPQAGSSKLWQHERGGHLQRYSHIYGDHCTGITVNVYIFALYIFSRYSCLSNVRQNIYIVKITFIMLQRGNNFKNAKINLREIANFRKCANIYTRENIYVHSTT